MRLARDSGFKISLKNTIYYSAVSVPLTIVVSCSCSPARQPEG